MKAESIQSFQRWGQDSIPKAGYFSTILVLASLFAAVIFISQLSSAFAQPAAPDPLSGQREQHDSQPPVEAPSLRVLQHTIRSDDRSANYASAKQQQQKPSPVGSATVVPVAKEQFAVAQPEHGNEKVEVEPPRLTALVSVSRNLNPFSLDSDLVQHLTLRDVLLTASGANLNILQSVSLLQARKWEYANAMTSFLPTINLGFNEIGLNSDLQLPLKSTGVFPGTSTPVTAQISQVALSTPLTVLNSGFAWTPIQGGRLLSKVYSQKHQLNAAKARLHGDISDTLLAATNSYWDLMYNGAVLQIRVAAVNNSEEQVSHNSSLANHGMATGLDVLQAKAQLAKERQNLLDQQRIRRGSAIKLAHLLNLNLGQDLIPAETVLRKARLLSSDMAVKQLLSLALDNRPELKQYEELRLAAKPQIKTARADLLPTVSLGGNILGIASNVGAMNPTYFLNFGVSWQLAGLGTTALTNVEAARWQARQSMLQAHQVFLNVFDQVRNSYNETITTEQAIDEATNEVVSSEEELRLARLRLDHGLGTNLEVVIAQRDLTQARVDQALALVNFNKSQAQLLHDIGRISIETVTSGRVITTSPPPR